MKLKELLFLIQQAAEKNQISRPWIVGGVPRDKVLGKQVQFHDLDLTTGDASIFRLGPIIKNELSPFNPNLRLMNDGHGKLTIGELQIDFSNHFVIPKIENYLAAKSLSTSEISRELHSRDFFCNTLLMDLELKKILDLTQEGISDIRKQQIRTCLNPNITFRFDPKRLARAIYLAAKLDFSIEPQTKEWMKNNPKYLQQISSNYLVKKILKALELNSQKTVDLLDELNYWPYLPATKELIPYIQGHLL